MQSSSRGHRRSFLPFKQMDLSEGEKGEGGWNTACPFSIFVGTGNCGGGELLRSLSFYYESTGASLGVSKLQSLGVTAWAGGCCLSCSQQPLAAGCNYALQLQRKSLAVESVQGLAAAPLLLRVQWRWRE